MSESLKGGIGVAAGLVTILGFFGLRTIYDLWPKTDVQEHATEPSPVESTTTSQPASVQGKPVQVSMPLPALETFEVHVPAQSQWIDTGVDLLEGQYIEINATGRVKTIDNTYESVGPSGGSYQCTQECTYPEGSFGQLIGSIGNQSDIFIVGQHMSSKALGRGRLYLGVNDCCNWSDNSGYFTASISVRK